MSGSTAATTSIQCYSMEVGVPGPQCGTMYETQNDVDSESVGVSQTNDALHTYPSTSPFCL